MPTTVLDAFRFAGLDPKGVVRWGEPVPERSPGVYVVALTEKTDSFLGATPDAPLSDRAVTKLLEARPELTLDGARPHRVALLDRLQRFWLPDEVIVYVGKASSLSSRVADYYSTPLGARRPHAGGYFVKLLSNLEDLYVHFARTDGPGEAEDAMLRGFCGAVSAKTSARLLDPAHPFPFANLEWPQGVRKAHGIRGAREPRTGPGRRTSKPVTSAVPPVRTQADRSLAGVAYRTQQVTDADLRAGQIRIPVSTPTKSLFPSDKTSLTVRLRGAELEISWDPRIGPDRERSGVLRFRDKAALRSLVRPSEVLRVTLESQGISIA